MNFWNRIANVDRRVLYLLLALSVALPLITKPRTTVPVSEAVKGVYDAVEALPAGSVVMISIDYDPSSAPEVQPMLIALLRHSFRRNLRVVVMGHLALGLPLADIALNQVAPEMDKEYGRDYVNLGYRPGSTALMVGIGREFRDYFQTDYRGVPIDSFEFMRRVHNYRDVGLLVSLAHGTVADYWIQYAGGRFNVPIIVGCTGVSAPSMYPYLRAGQIKGILGGLLGAAAYEQLIEHRGSASLGMPAQSWGHGLIIALLIIGNVGFLLSRRKGKK